MPAAAQAPRLEQRKIADNVYMMENPTGSSNSTFVVTDDGVFVWDADIRSADQVVAAIRRTTDKKIRYVAISHPAGDHATGVWHLREDKPIFIATRKQMRDLYQQEGAQFAERKASTEPQYAAYRNAELVLPDVAFEGAMTVRFGGLTFQLTEEGTAHSTSDVTLYIPQKRVLLMGDLLDTEIHPGQGESAGVFYSNAKNWIGLLDNIIARRLPVDTYVPGHGPAHLGRGVADLEEQRKYFLVMRDEVSKMIMAGKTVEQVQAEFKMPAEFAHYRSAVRLKNFLNLFYHQLIEQGFWP
jgi:glyoxylase-like metal-dependent hydrolase (beta-lactamase superfamily II)